MDISIIIRAYNEEKYLAQLLESIYSQQCTHSYETILVDSGSTDDTLLIAKKYPVRIVSILKENFSFGYSLNQGIEHANGNYCIMISAHCIPVTDNWLENMVKPLIEDEKVALVYGRQEGNEKTRYSEQQIFSKWFPKISYARQKNPFCNNANSAIRKELWQKIKYDETLTGLEDLDWAKKVIAEGFYLYYNADASVYHLHNETYHQVYNRYRREAITLSNVLYHAKFSFLDFIKLSVWNILVDWTHSFRDGRFKAYFTDIALFRTAQFWGTYRGYRLTKDITAQLRERFYYPPKYEKKDSENDSLKLNNAKPVSRYANI